MRVSPAIVGVACLLATGVALAADETEEVREMREACEGGNSNSCNNLGFMYAFGDGVEQDTERQVFYYGKACDGGALIGCSNLANLYLHGGAVEQDITKGKEFLQRSCDGGEVDECVTLGSVILTATEDVSSDGPRALALFEKSCLAGVGEGCFYAGLVHGDALGVEQDYAKALVFFVNACENRSAEACGFAGDLYLEGEEGVAQDDALSLKFHGMACEAGDTELCNVLGHMFENGIDVAPDANLALRYYRASCSSNDEEGCASLQRLFPGKSCPCFNEAEVLAVCPRPDASATQRLVQSGDEDNRRLECYSTRNYSPGSFIFDVFPASAEGEQPQCFVQSVDRNESSSGRGMHLSDDWLSGCLGVLDNVGAKLGLELTQE